MDISRFLKDLLLYSSNEMVNSRQLSLTTGLIRLACLFLDPIHTKRARYRLENWYGKHLNAVSLAALLGVNGPIKINVFLSKRCCYSQRYR